MTQENSSTFPHDNVTSCLAWQVYFTPDLVYITNDLVSFKMIRLHLNQATNGPNKTSLRTRISRHFRLEEHLYAAISRSEFISLVLTLIIRPVLIIYQADQIPHRLAPCENMDKRKRNLFKKGIIHPSPLTATSVTTITFVFLC